MGGDEVNGVINIILFKNYFMLMKCGSEYFCLYFYFGGFRGVILLYIDFDRGCRKLFIVII